MNVIFSLSFKGLYNDDRWDTIGNDSTWILSSAFMILTMQSGFALLEVGYANPRNTTSVLMKNVVDVVVGGLAFWMCGFAFAFGNGNPFCGTNGFLLEPGPGVKSGLIYASFIFHFAYASTATTIVSGAVAGRMKFNSYIMFSFFSSIFYGFPAHWVWARGGFLQQFGFFDFAGCGPVHLFGGCGALYGCLDVGARTGRFKPDGTRGTVLAVYDPFSVIGGFLIIWWGWIGFNCGSTFGSSGVKGTVACRIGATTVVSACAGGFFYLLKIFLPRHVENLRVSRLTRTSLGEMISAGRSSGNKRPVSMQTAIDIGKALKSAMEVENNQIRVDNFTNAIIASLVAITASCNCVNLRSAFLIGFFAPSIAHTINEWTKYFGIDDPVGAIGVHGACGIYGILSIGLYADPNLPGALEYMPGLEKGIFLGGPFIRLGKQMVGTLAIIAWGMISSWMIFSYTGWLQGGNRVSLEVELDGMDIHEHGYDLLLAKGSEVETMARRRRGKRMTDVEVNEHQGVRNIMHGSSNSDQENEAIENYAPDVIRNSEVSSGSFWDKIGFKSRNDDQVSLEVEMNAVH